MPRNTHTVDESIAAAYVDRTGMSLADVKALMDAETWLSAQDCVDRGFATDVAELPAEQEALAMAQARSFKALVKLRNLPAALRAKAISPLPAAAADAECACPCEACEDGDCTSCSNKDCTDANCRDCPMQNDEDLGNESNLSLFEARAKALTMRKRF